MSYNMENSFQELNTAQALEEWAYKINEYHNKEITIKEWCKLQDIQTEKFYYQQKNFSVGLLLPENILVNYSINFK